MQRLDIHLKPSKITIFLIVLLWLGGIVLIMSLDHLGWIRGVFVLILSIYGWHMLRRHGFLLGPHALQGLKHVSHDQWQIKTNQGEYMARLKGDSTVSSLFCVLCFELTGKPSYYSCLLCYDAFEFDTFRQLLLRLRCFRPTPE